MGGHAWRKQRSLVRLVIEEEFIGKRPLETQVVVRRLREGHKTIGPRIRWGKVAEERDRWQDLFLVAWS